MRGILVMVKKGNKLPKGELRRGKKGEGLLQDREKKGKGFVT